MKRQFALLLAAVLMAFSLTACGSDRDTNGDQDRTQDSITDAGGDQDHNNQTDGTDKDRLPDTSGDADKDTKPDDGDTDMDLLPDDTDKTNQDNEVLEGTERALRSSGVNMSSTHAGSTFGQMLRNARVHDTDGYLKDGENAVSTGAA